ncbi:nucleotidyltransferase family protein [Halochromatium salexigens]|uniref:Molybdopterin-guanine dinucleotide biosynthesis protein MobA n=1 Tax=Halochromatium salexigens TaxID=49447 RepID=A0AAJ0UH47_HALSE|nr:nucleotidyltransferase family protein [Halochromatium salexigens]MBK5930725.1 molybdopterin-guanine dinucleotide biosynthesis protein MobA [Halochromatium salexigens]
MPVGLLLAAGEGRRFGSDKRLHVLPDGTPMVVAAARPLRLALSRVLAVVREPGPVADRLAAEGVDVMICPAASAGMGHSIACGVAASRDADGWLIALGDMPWVSTRSIAAVAETLTAGASVARPVYEGVAGHPVAFSAAFGATLLGLQGDQGARGLLRQAAVTEVRCTDPGVLRDVDRPRDLRLT